MDRGAWQATTHRVTKSQTQLKQLSICAVRFQEYQGHQSQRKQHGNVLTCTYNIQTNNYALFFTKMFVSLYSNLSILIFFFIEYNITPSLNKETTELHTFKIALNFALIFLFLEIFHCLAVPVYSLLPPN